MAATYNVNRDPKKHPQAITAADIFPGIAGTARENREATAAELDLFFTGIVVEQQKKATKGGSLSPLRRRKVSRDTMKESEG